MPSLEDRLQKLSLYRSPQAREFLAELLGTFVLVTIGDGAVAQFVLSARDFANPMSLFWGFCLGLTLGGYVAGGISGGHLNPAVTVAFAVIGRFSWLKVPVYALAQYIGAFIGSCCIYGVYFDALNKFDGGQRVLLGPNGTAGIFSNYPKAFVTLGGGFADQLYGAFLLMLLIMAVTDERNNRPSPGMVPAAVGIVLFAIGVSFGYNCGFAVNPARDLGPRIFTYVAGWGQETFSFRGYLWFWMPVVAAHLGAILGALTYVVMIAMHWPRHHHYSEDANLEMEEDLGSPRLSQGGRKGNSITGACSSCSVAITRVDDHASVNKQGVDNPVFDGDSNSTTHF